MPEVVRAPCKGSRNSVLRSRASGLVQQADPAFLQLQGLWGTVVPEHPSWGCWAWKETSSSWQCGQLVRVLKILACPSGSLFSFDKITFCLCVVSRNKPTVFLTCTFPTFRKAKGKDMSIPILSIPWWTRQAAIKVPCHLVPQHHPVQSK